eukprot:CAMPEP_0201567062 /NCGR_PEP_ID=MMETSP0190_2-20130828/7334_1 /ASSEMBLY_ACC=CAM_ASM_000263 /TAXON_ID=37353 /ORGANISM="Rosalina sp." /LENGTH=418 /DNA_ID=CAMNT_0047986597 /DNA_START=42 /DNA_END=1298 /DNA_ORIENTATION=+
MSGKMINIGGDANDANYRYKMPPLTTKIEGRGNGIKTVLMNIPDVAKALHTEPSYATKFFGMEVGALSQYDHKRNVGIVHGVHQSKELQTMMKKFIREFILCPKCKLPELQFKVHQKKNVLLQKCASCGWKGSNASNHKVKTYIINHPPQKKDKDKNKKAGKKDKRSKKDKKKKKGDEEEQDLPEGKDDFKELGWDNDDVWSVDTSEDAVAKRKQQEMATLATKSKRVKVDGNDGENEPKKKGKKGAANDDNSPPQILRNYINSAERSNLEILDEVKRISLARKYDQKKKLQLAIEALCKLDTLDNFIETLEKYKAILSTFTKNPADAKVFFGVLEEFVCRRNPDEFLGKVYKILECLYDNDIAEEDDMIKWAELDTDKAVIVDQDEAESIRQKAAPFIKWLRENDDESSEEDEDEES